MPKSKRKARSNNKSGFIGVRKNGKYGKYVANISIGNGKEKYLGSFDTVKQAAKAYDREAIKLRRPFFKLNFPKKAPVGYTPIQKALLSTNTVGYRGVSKDKKKFKADLRIAGKLTYMGTYDTAKEAAIVYDRAILKAKKSKSLLNFPDMVHNLDVEPKRTKQKVRSDNTICYKGVSKYCNKHGDKFKLQITINGKRKIVCGFTSALDAALAYDQAAVKNGNKSHTLNFPMDQKEKKKQKKHKEKKKLKKKEKKEKKKQKKTKKKELTFQEYKEMLHA